jgi:exportin-7
MMQLNTVQCVLKSYDVEKIRFLTHGTNYKARTIFYMALCRLINLEENFQKLLDFIKLFQNILVSFKGQQSKSFNKKVSVDTIEGTMRDLIGLIKASTTRKSYGVMFNWLYPHFSIILATLKEFGYAPSVTTAILRFTCEFVCNKSQRIDFGISSPNGILLFREVSKVFVIYNEIVKTKKINDDEYRFKYKGIWLCLQVLSLSLSGCFCNFGVFDLYNDKSLDNAFNAAVNMIMKIPVHHSLAYRKINCAYYGLLEVICGSHLTAITMRDTQTFAFF